MVNDKDKLANDLFKDNIDKSSSIATGAVNISEHESMADLVAKMNPVPPPPKPNDTDKK